MASDSSVRLTPPAQQLHRASAVSRILSVLGAALALGAIVFATYRIQAINDQVTAAKQQLKDLNDSAAKKQKELAEAESKLNQVNGELAFAQATYKRIAKDLPAGVAQHAIQEAAAADPHAATLPPVIYLHVAREDQRAKARLIQDQLRASGYTVPGIEYVGAKAPNHSQLRYFVRTDEGPMLDKVLAQLRALGVDIDSQYIKMTSEAPRALRPNQFEVWLGQDYKPNQ
jgi:septal ring factor EnvC (AmiA/AmiB activator)